MASSPYHKQEDVSNSDVRAVDSWGNAEESDSESGSPSAARNYDSTEEENQFGHDPVAVSGMAIPTRYASTGSMMQAQATRNSFHAPDKWITAFGAVLAMCAGIVNVASLLGLETLVSHLTGVTTKLAMHVEGIRINAFSSGIVNENNPLTESTVEFQAGAAKSAVSLILSFIFGSFLCGLVVPENALHFGGKSFYGVALIMNSAFLIACTFLSGVDKLIAACCAACACGLQNAMCTMHLGAVVRTTHITGTGTDIGSAVGRIVMILIKTRCKRRHVSRTAQAQLDVQIEKLQILLSLFISFALGCYIGAYLYGLCHTWTFLIPAGITGSLGIAYTFFRESMKNSFKNMHSRKLDHDIERMQDAISRTANYATAARRGGNSSASDAEQGNGHSDMHHHISSTLHVLHSLEENFNHLFKHHHAFRKECRS